MGGSCGRHVLLLCDCAEAAEAAERALDELGVGAGRHRTVADACAAGEEVAVVVAREWPPREELRLAAGSPRRTAIVATDRLTDEQVAGLFVHGADDFVHAQDDAAVLEALAHVLGCEDLD